LPHDWLTWRLADSGQLADLMTDRGDASGTGYWSPRASVYRDDLLERAMGQRPHLPRVLGPNDTAGLTRDGAMLGPGSGDNAAAALGVGAGTGDVVISIGTSGVVSAVSDAPTADPTGLVAGFASATGSFLPLACTLNGARVLDATAAMLGISHGELSRLALECPAGADGLVLVPYLEGERTPNLPEAQGALHGLSLRNATSAHLARASVEGLMCLIADAVDALLAQGVTAERFILVGGAARSSAVQHVAAEVLGREVVVPPPGEYVADGAARQAAWVLSGAAEPPAWTSDEGAHASAPATPHVRAQYAAVRDMTIR
jgi:xylulokinase